MKLTRPSWTMNTLFFICTKNWRQTLILQNTIWICRVTVLYYFHYKSQSILPKILCAFSQLDKLPYLFICSPCKWNLSFPLWIFSPLSLPPTVASGGQPHHALDGHHGSAGVMRERRAAGDPYWSYSGELSFVRQPELSVGGEMYFFDSLTPATSCLYHFPLSVSHFPSNLYSLLTAVARRAELF